MKQSRGLTLVELLIVVALLAVIAGVVVSGYGQSNRHAEQIVVHTEMRSIREAFGRFRADCCPPDLDEVRKFGLWPLMASEHPDKGAIGYTVYDGYDPATASGWSGPYLASEGMRTVDDEPDRMSGRRTFGQETEPTGTKVPVVLSPWGEHYRVMAPKDASYDYDTRRLLLVCLGALGEREWDAGQGRYVPVDEAQQEQDLLADLQEGIDDWLYAPETLTPALTPDEALAKLAGDFPAQTFQWLIPSEAREVP